MQKLSKYAIPGGEPISITNLTRDIWCRFQGELFSEIQAAVGPLLKIHQRFVTVLEMVCLENFIRRIPRRDGRPLSDRVNLARDFLAKAMWDIPTTRALIECLKVDRQLRNLCGWVLISEISSKSTFSRAFANPRSTVKCDTCKSWE